MTLYHKGDAVPRDWFKVYDRVESAVFASNVNVTMVENVRHIEYADNSDDAMILVTGGRIDNPCVVEFAILTHFHTRPTR
jgi:hypothetical protein